MSLRQKKLLKKSPLPDVDDEFLEEQPVPFKKLLDFQKQPRVRKKNLLDSAKQTPDPESRKFDLQGH